jgi:WD40 repeat protein
LAPALLLLALIARGANLSMKSKVKSWLTTLTLLVASCGLVSAQTAPDRIWVGSGHAAAAYATAYAPDGNLLASGSDDRTIKLWHTADGSQAATLTGHTDVIRAVNFSHDGGTLASGSADTTIKLWRVSDGALLRTLTGHSAGVRSVAFSPDGTLLASASQDNTIKLWLLADGSLVRTLNGHGNWVVSVAFSPDGSQLASGSYDRTIKLWRIADGQMLGSLSGHSSYVFHVAFSPDGTTLASASWDLTARLWRVADGAQLASLPCVNGVYTAEFSPDGTTLVTSDVSYNIWFWRVADATVLQKYVEVAATPTIVFSPDGTKVGYGRGDSAVVLARTSGGTPPPTLDVLASTDKPSYANRETATILVSVTDGFKAVVGANVSASVTASKGNCTTYTGTTGANGVAVFSYKVNSKLGLGTYKVGASATKTGCNPGSDPTTFQVTR